MLVKLFILLTIIYLLGMLLTLILFKFKISAFLKSELSKKILLWIPITLVFLFFTFSENRLRLIGFMLLLIGIYYEQLKVIKQKHLFRFFLFLSVIPFTISLLHLLLLVVKNQHNATEILIILGVSASLSDVVAFFFGKFLGKHKLPKIINAKKTWEGILGQIIGALIAVFVLKLFLFPEINIFLFLPIGIGSAFGDIYNSFLKRKAEIRNWSEILPGHGGFSDRFASIAGSSLLSFYFLLLFH